MRLLFVHNVSDLYGASRALLRMTTRLRADGHDIMVVLPGDGPLRFQLEEAGITTTIHASMPIVARPSVRAVWSLARALFAIPASFVFFCKLAKEFKPDVMHTNTSFILTPGLAARAMGIPHVWHMREVFFEFARLWRFYQWYIYILADKILCVSNTVFDQFHPRIRQTKLQMLYDGMPRSEFARPSPGRIEAYRHHYGLDGQFVVGVAGRINLRRKGQGVVVEAAHQLCSKHPRLRFFFVGSPFPGNESHLENLQEMIRKYRLQDRVIFAGESDDMPVAYSAFDVSLMPSGLPEAFGNVVAESMAMERPVIGSRVGGIAEQIEDGISGLLVAPNDPSALAAAVERILNDEALRIRLAKNGRARYLERFEFERFYETLLLVYSAVHARTAITTRRSKAAADVPASDQFCR